MSKEEIKLVSMNVNGHSKVPPGFRFHPTEEELLHYYLRKKVVNEKIDLDVIPDVDLNKLEPWDIQDKCNIGSTLQNDWYFFSHKDKKYPTGTRTNRATAAGFWKATGRDKVIHSSLQRIGMRKTLVFYKGRAPHGQKSDWIMHEYRLDDNVIPTQSSSGSSSLSDCGHEEGWVVCRVFKKKYYHKPQNESPQRSSVDSRAADQLNKDGALDHLLAYMDSTTRSSKQGTESFTNSHDAMQQFLNYPMINNDLYVHLPRLDSPSMNPTRSSPATSPTFQLKTYNNSMNDVLPEVLQHTRNDIDKNMGDEDHECISNWADLDRFVASQLNGEVEESKNQSSCYDEKMCCLSVDHEEDDHASARVKKAEYTSDVDDIWSLARPSLSTSSLDPLCHLSV